MTKSQPFLLFIAAVALSALSCASSTDATCQETQQPSYYKTQISLIAPVGTSCTADDLTAIGVFLDDHYDDVVEQTDDLGPVSLQTHVCPDTSTPSTQCCSWDLKTCGEDTWCNENGNNCEAYCDGFWIDPQNRLTCFARWSPCTDSNECCGGSVCLLMSDGTHACSLPSEGHDHTPSGCCSWDLRDCQNNEYCDFSQENCEGPCVGKFLPSGYNTNCAARWEGCSVDSDCCGHVEFGTTCQNLGSHMGCHEVSSRRLVDDARKLVEDARKAEHRKLVFNWYHYYFGTGNCRWCDPEDSEDDTGGGRRLQQQQSFATIVENMETDLSIYLTSAVNTHFGLDSTSCLHGYQATIIVAITELSSESEAVAEDTC